MDTILENFKQPEILLKLPCFMMKTFAQNKEFFGRQEILEQMRKALIPSGPPIASGEPGALRSVVLFGHGGFGKSEIAVQFAFCCKESFDAVFWIRAEDVTKLDNDFRDISISLGLQDSKTSQNPVITRNMVKEWLSNPRKILHPKDDQDSVTESVTWLLVFDNADDRSILRDYIDDINGSGSIIITSRDPAAKDLFIDNCLSLEVVKFGVDEGVEFLQSQSHRTADMSDVCRQIVEYHDGHPLALAQIAGFLQHEYLSYRDILQYLEDPMEKALLYDHKFGIKKTARGTTASLLAMGMEHLPRESRELLELMSFLDPDRVQENVLQKQYVPASKYHQARKYLLQTSLIRRNEHREELWMHRVDQAAIKESMSMECRTSTFCTALRLIKDAWPTVPYRARHQVQRWPRCEALFPHVEVLQEYYDGTLKSLDADVEMTLAELAQEAAWCAKFLFGHDL